MIIISKISSQVLVVLQSRMGFAALVLALLCGFVASTPLPEKVDTGDGGGEDEDGGGGDDDDDQL